MSDDQFMKLFKYVEETRHEVAEIREDMATKKDVGELRDTVINYAEHLDTYAQEMAALDHKIDRLERCIQVIAKKTGVDLDSIHA